MQRSGIICLAEPLFGILSTRRLTRASELSLKTTSELESVRTEVVLNVLRVLALASIGEKSGVRARTCVAGPKLDLRRHALMLALGLAPFAMAGQAKAECAPAAPINNTTVNCTGTTINQNDPFGYGTLNDTGNTYNILSGASLTGTQVGLALFSGIVNNFGTISAGVNGAGIFAREDVTVHNAGAISAIGEDSIGILANRSANVINARTGTISGGDAGISANVAANVISSGRISGAIAIVADGVGGVGSTITNSGAIVSTAGASGTAIELSSAADSLTLLAGSRIIGAIKMGFGNDVVNFVSGKDAAQLVTLNQFAGTINASGGARWSTAPPGSPASIRPRWRRPIAA